MSKIKSRYQQKVKANQQKKREINKKQRKKQKYNSISTRNFSTQSLKKAIESLKNHSKSMFFKDFSN
jgi:hypothetical protein